MPRLYCPQCRDVVTDEQCPHWDYEHDPRYSRRDVDIVADVSLPRETREAARERDHANQRAAADAIARYINRKG